MVIGTDQYCSKLRHYLVFYYHFIDLCKVIVQGGCMVYLLMLLPMVSPFMLSTRHKINDASNAAID